MSDETTQTEINPNEAINYTTLSEKLNALNNSRLAIISALNENGAEAPTETKFSSIPDIITNMKTGSIDSLSGFTVRSIGSDIAASGNFTAEYPGILYCKYTVQCGEHTNNTDGVVFYTTVTSPNNEVTDVLRYTSNFQKTTTATTMASFDAGDIISWNAQPRYSGSYGLNAAVSHEICSIYIV